MKIHTIHDLSNTYVTALLEAGLSAIEEHDLAVNYHPLLQSESSNIFYLLNNGRYNVGSYYVLEEDGKYVGSAGWNHYNDNTALVLTRAYIDKNYRTQYLMAEYFLPKIFNEAESYEKLWITCNDYNKSIYAALIKMSENQNAGMFNSWPEIYKKFKPAGTKLVNNTVQYVAEHTKDNKC